MRKKELEIVKEAWEINQPGLWAQRIGIVLLCLLLTAAMIGLLGPGLIGKQRVFSAARDFDVSYYPFIRSLSQNGLIIRFTPEESTIKAQQFGIWIAKSYLSNLEIKQILPKPIYEESQNDRLVFYFRVSPTQNKISINFLIETNRPEIAKGEIGILNGSNVRFTQVVYP